MKLSEKEKRLRNLTTYSNSRNYLILEFFFIHGMMKWWKNGILILIASFSFINFLVKRVPSENPLSHYSITPVFHYSNLGV